MVEVRIPGIAFDTVAAFQHRVVTFRPSYIADWDTWLGTPSTTRPFHIGRILRKWNACRPNRMRRDAAAKMHDAPYLDDLLARAAPHIEVLSTFDICESSALENSTNVNALESLWDVFEQLSYEGRARGGVAGAVGIWKAVMLATDGKVGPAFDRNVRKNLQLAEICTAAQWQCALRVVRDDIQTFHDRNGATLAEAKPRAFQKLENGRIYDMALGPR
jgi:hypothetical protein